MLYIAQTHKNNTFKVIQVPKVYKPNENTPICPHA